MAFLATRNSFPSRATPSQRGRAVGTLNVVACVGNLHPALVRKRRRKGTWEGSAMARNPYEDAPRLRTRGKGKGRIWLVVIAVAALATTVAWAAPQGGKGPTAELAYGASHLAPADGRVTLTETVTFGEPRLDEEYVLTATLHAVGDDGSDQGAIIVGGSPVEASARLVPQEGGEGPEPARDARRERPLGQVRRLLRHPREGRRDRRAMGGRAGRGAKGALPHAHRQLRRRRRPGQRAPCGEGRARRGHRGIRERGAGEDLSNRGDAR